VDHKKFKLAIGEKIGYALGDTAANIAWRSLTTFLLVFYVDVFGISAAAAGLLLLITRFSDGITDIIMGMITDRTNTKYGKFRPWILWSTVPFGVLMALTFTTPNLGETGKLI
jgi:GPH family glycoside/pentoside/hexuronide:cation symporter